MNKINFSLLLSLFFILTSNAINIEYTNDNSAVLRITIPVNSKDIVFKDYLNISIDNPDIELSNIKFLTASLNEYVPDFNKKLDVYKQDFEISIEAKKLNTVTQNSNIFISFCKNNKDEIEEQKYQVDIFTKQTVSNTQAEIELTAEPVAYKENAHKKSGFWHSVNKLSTYTQDTIKTNNSMFLRFILVFLLGLLMSLTPCIYPMIPITAGILQAQASKSVFKNFLLALSYTFGIATTFAVFGLSAAFTGNLFGKILMHPIFVLFIVSVLLYFAFAMLGFYEMYIPNSMQTGSSTNVNGTFTSAFVFGAISGSVASPCLSPGLALLLTIVATMGSKFLGFMLLFTFGVGLGIPLLIIGTFSSSLNVLPRSGFWMVEIKKLFAFMLFGMCFYFLSNILSYNKLIWLIALSILITGVYYLKSISEYDSRLWRNIKNIFGVSLSACSIIIFTKAYQDTFYPQVKMVTEAWLTDYDAAQKKAIQESKKLFIDIGADFCSLCKAIDAQILHNDIVKDKLEEFVTVKVNATDEASYPFRELKPKYAILGVPTILVIDPATGELYKKWGGELYNLTPEEFVKELEDLNV